MRKNNPKTLEMMKAKKQFIEDLYNDKDFIEFKNNSKSYGVVVITSYSYLLTRIGPQCQTIISQYLKSFNHATT